MSPRSTLAQILPITPWEQAPCGLRASKTSTSAHAGVGSFPGFRLPGFAKVPGPRRGGVRELLAVRARAPPSASSSTCWPKGPLLPPNRQPPCAARAPPPVLSTNPHVASAHLLRSPASREFLPGGLGRGP